MEIAIQTRGLVKKFDDFYAVRSLDLSVPAGSFFGFLGPNGAGKSTTIHMLTGLLTSSAGQVEILGYDLDRERTAIKQKIGVVPEKLAFFDRLSASEYLTFVGRMYGLSPAETQKRSQDLLQLMGLSDDAGKWIVDFSHGMKKKLALASALIHNPKLIFLDEPFEGIDAVASRTIKNLLFSLTQKGTTIFLTSHILEIVEKLCDQIAIIHKGELVLQGAKAALSADGSSLEQKFIDLVGGSETAQSLDWLGQDATI